MALATWSATDQQNTSLDASKLVCTATATTGAARAANGFSSGKWYFEVTFTTVASSSSGVGIATATAPFASLSSNATGAAIAYLGGSTWVNGANSSGNSIGFPTNGSVVCVAVDIGAKSVWFRLSATGSWNATSGTSKDPATGVGGISVSALTLPLYPVCCPFQSGDKFTANFGQAGFVGAVPSGYTPGFGLTDAQVTQAAVEQWLAVNPDAQITQVAVEQWSSAQSGALQMVATQVAAEMWASVALIDSGSPARVMVMA